MRSILNNLFWIQFIVFTIGHLACFSQNIKPSVHYLNYTINENLPSSETYDIIQDSKGYLWIGTDNGVSRYNGHQFENFTTRDGLTDNTVFKIEEDHLGRIWFMTFNRKLCYYYNNRFYDYKYNDKLVDGTSDIFFSNTITNFEIDHSGKITLTLVNFSKVFIDEIGDITISLNPYNLWPHHNPNFNLLDLTLYLKPDLHKHQSQEKIIIREKNHRKLHFLRAGSLFAIGTDQGLFFLSHSYDSIYLQLFHDITITGMAIDFEGGLWCSSLHNGIFYVPNINLVLYKTSATKNMHCHGFIPQDTNLFISFGQSKYEYNVSKNILSQTDTYIDLTKIPSNLKNQKYKFENPVEIKQIYSPVSSFISIDSNSMLFSGAVHGLHILQDNYSSTQLDSIQNTFKPYQILSLDPITWYKSKNGFLSIDGQKRLYNRLLKEFKPRVICTFIDKTKIVWFGTFEGLYHFNPKSEKITKVNSEITNYRIQDITQSNDQTLFFASKSHGIMMIKNDSISYITSESGLLTNTVYQLEYDPINNQVWAATSGGISRLSQNVINQKWIPRSIITKYDGLASKDIRQISFFDKYLFFANNNGIDKIRKDYLNDSLPSPILYIQSLFSNEASKSIDSTISLSYDSNNVKVSYHAISYKSQNDIAYKYQLQPINISWQTTTNNNIIFNALPPDDYTFRLKAVNIDGMESEIKTLKFSIIPAFWMTWWFKIIIIVIAIIIGYKISIKTIQTYKSQAQFQRTINEMQIVSLQSKMNPHFIFNSLNSIQNYILKNEKVNANEYLLEFSKLIRTILQNSDSPTILLTDELDTLRMYINLEKKRIRGEFKYIENIDSGLDFEHCIIPSLLIQPYIENAIWHGKVYSNPNGEIILNIIKKETTLFFEIIDNGIGIKNAEASKIKKTKHQSLGTSVTKKRIQLLSELNNEMSDVIISEAFTDKEIFVGTKISFSIPYILKHNS